MTQQLWDLSKPGTSNLLVLFRALNVGDKITYNAYSKIKKKTKKAGEKVRRDFIQFLECGCATRP